MRQLRSVASSSTFHARQCVTACLLLGPASLLAETQSPAQTQTQTPTQAHTTATTQTQPQAALHIRILNARTNKPVPDERLNVALRVEQIGSVAMAADKRGVILVNPGDAATIRVLANMYADCRPRAELYTNYPVNTIRQSGITTGNLCSSAHPDPKPGELLLFVIPKTYIRTMGQPPVTDLPHSDENPNQ